MKQKVCFAVDRVEGNIAVLDNGQNVPRGSLREGQVFCWTGKKWKRDKGEERRRLREVREILEQLKRTDPGGNIRL